MDRGSLAYFEEILAYDVQGLTMATQVPEVVPDDDLKRALNVKLEAIKSDVANIQHMLES